MTDIHSLKKKTHTHKPNQKKKAVKSHIKSSVQQLQWIAIWTTLSRLFNLHYVHVCANVRHVWSVFIGARRGSRSLWWVVVSCLTRVLEIKLRSYGRTASAVNFFLNHLSGPEKLLFGANISFVWLNTEVFRHVHNFLRPTKKEKKNQGDGIMQTFKRRALLSLAMGWESLEKEMQKTEQCDKHRAAGFLH